MLLAVQRFGLQLIGFPDGLSPRPSFKAMCPRYEGKPTTVCRMGMTGRDVGPADGLGLADAIGLLRDELLEAQAAGAGSDIQLPVESMTVVLKVTANQVGGRQGGF